MKMKEGEVKSIVERGEKRRSFNKYVESYAEKMRKSKLLSETPRSKALKETSFLRKSK